MFYTRKNCSVSSRGRLYQCGITPSQHFSYANCFEEP